MKYKLLLTFYSLLLTIAAYAQNSTASNTAISLNGEWQFQTDANNVGEAQQWYAHNEMKFADHLTVPGNWDTENRYAAYTGKGWYKKTVFIPASLKGKLIRLYFEGVYNLARVWVNGKFVTDNDLGYLQFEKEVSALLEYGAQNTIVVCADNTFKIGALWNWGGIRRPVKLLVNDPVYIRQNHVTPQVNLANSSARVNFDLSLANVSYTEANISGKIEITTPGTSVITIPFKTTIPSSGMVKQRLEARLDSNQFRLWNLDEPNLYRYKITLYKNKMIMDEFSGHFGLRTIELNKQNHQLKLNGKVIRPLGLNLVPDDRTNGNSLPLWRVKEDIDLMKSLGAGVTRLAHMPFHQELLDYLDEKGILIFEEIPLWGDDNSFVKNNNPITNKWLQRMISDHYNHPCIAGWSVGNEIGKNKEAMGYVDTAIQLVKHLDTTRMGVMASHTAYNVKDPLLLSDIGFINVYGRIWLPVNRIHRAHPESTLFLSEFGTGQLNEDLATDFPIQMLMDSLAQKPYLIGASLWTFNDYRSNYKETKEPSQNRPWGLVDAARQKKQAYFSFQRTNKPVGLEIHKTELDGSANFRTTVTVKPRRVYDLPAYELMNYRIVLKLMDIEDRLTGGTFQTLPKICPGDSSFDIQLNATGGTRPFKANISLVSPQNYTLYDTVIYFQKPLKPTIIYTGGGSNTLADGKKEPLLQVRYEKNGSASYYKLSYRTQGAIKETQLTTNSYVNLIGLSAADITDVQLISVNNVGELAVPVSFTKTGTNPMPPVIRFTEPADGAFFTGLETTNNHQKFIVQTTTVRGNYSHSTITTTETKGTVKVSGLINGKTYYYRVKSTDTDRAESGWSEEVTVKPDGGLLPVSPRIQGVIRKGKEVILCFEPVKKSTGYDLLYRAAGEKKWNHQAITSSQANQHKFIVTAKDSKVEIKLAAINQYGKSVYAEL